MESQELRLVDTFAEEPFGGVPLPVVAGGVDDDRLRALAREVGAPGAVTDDGGLRYADRGGVHAPVTAAVAGGVGLHAADALAAGDHTLVHAGTEYDIAVESDRHVAVEAPAQQVAGVRGRTEEAASALGIDPTGIRAVESLPVGRAGDTLVVPVSYLEHLTAATPDDDALATVFAESDIERALAVTFDTLHERADVHARVFARDEGIESTYSEVAASGIAAAGCGAYLAEFDAFDGDREKLRIESGHALDRPAGLTTTLAERPTVTGSGLVAVDGTVSLPEPTSDDIVEL
jgi:predicted PhzF superfamily epimerase YddE/YHI9